MLEKKTLPDFNTRECFFMNISAEIASSASASSQ